MITRRPTAAGVAEAAVAVSRVVHDTPLIGTRIAGGAAWLKAECQQPVGSFKLRGAWWRLSCLTKDERRAGVVAFSSGNHAQGVAWAARKLGMNATIVMPRDAPAPKIAGTRALGAEIVFYDRLIESREAIAAALATGRGATLVPSFDDPWVIEGQGSAGVEIARQLGRAPARVVVCCGGGGLSAGIALALPDAEIVIVEPEGWDDMGRSLRAGAIEPVGPNPPPTACDALQTLRVSALTFDVLRERGASGVAVSEAEVAAAMRWAAETHGLTVEPGGAVALAAVLSGKVPAAGSVVTLSGGNVDPERFRALTGRAPPPAAASVAR